MDLLLVIVVLFAVVAIVVAPLRGRSADATGRRERAELAELEAAKEAKYREIRDAELDLRTGKLSEEDHRALDRTLRAEAIELLRRIDALAPEGSAAGDGGRTRVAAPDDRGRNGSRDDGRAAD